MTNDFVKIRSSYNFSFMEMIHYVQGKTKEDQIKSMTLNVLKAVLEKNQGVFEYSY